MGVVKKNSLGQYFTKSVLLKQKVFEFIKNNDVTPRSGDCDLVTPLCGDCSSRTILEPSIGRGDLVAFIKERLPDVSFDKYEIDTSIELLPGIIRSQVVYGDFMTQTIIKKYKTIIGNPPYIRTKTGNLYIDFIEKCYRLLENGGEMIFIVPSDFFKLTSASKLLTELLSNGSFTHIFHPHNEHLFDNACIDILVFRYQLGEPVSQVLYNDVLMNTNCNNGLVVFDKEQGKDVSA